MELTSKLKGIILSSQLGWKLTTNINDTRTLFTDEVLPYSVDSYICLCSHTEFILRSNDQEIGDYSCPICENNKFLDANLFLGNTGWYEPIEKKFSESYLKNLEIFFEYDDTLNTFLAIVFINIPNTIDLSTDTIQYTSKDIYRLNIDDFAEIEETLFADFELEQLRDGNRSYFDGFETQEELINKNPILIRYKKKILEEIKKNRYFNLSEDIYKKANTIEQIQFFVENEQLKEFDFYYWENIHVLPDDDIATIDEALYYVSNNTKAKTLKKAIFENYKEQLREYNGYNFIYPYCIAKYIKDVNIANRLIDLDFKRYAEFLINHDSIEYFLQYLTKHFSDKQIENLLKSYKKHEIFWFTHTIELFAELSEEMRENFPKVSCKYNSLHDEIVVYHRLAVEQRLLNIKFHYFEKQLECCVIVEPYEIRLPCDGGELYSWSNTLSNCLAGYSHMISEYKTTVYGFYQDERIKFAVEIKNNKIIQAKLKFNQELSKEDMALVLGWYEEYILKDEPNNSKQ